MSYVQTQSKLESLVRTAVRNEEIQEGAYQAGLDEWFLVSQLLADGRASEVWASAAREIEVYNQLDNAREAKLTELRAAKSSLRKLRWLNIGTSAISVIGVLASIYVILPRLLSLPDNLRYVLLLGLLIVGLLVLLYLYGRYTAGRTFSRDDRILTENQRELEIDELGERLVAAEQEVEKAVIERGILPELRLIINNYLTSYDMVLPISGAPGLAEVFYPAYEITTESREMLRHLLDTMPRGNIGIAGLPGAGKTTLLQSFCSSFSTVELKGRPVLSVMASVPIGYDAREFILHIFSSVCQRVLVLKGSSPLCPWTGSEQIEESEETEAAPKAVIDLRKAVTSVLPGLFLMTSELYLSNEPRFFFGLGLFLVILGLASLLAMTAIATRLLRRRTQSQRQVLLAQFGILDAEACRQLGQIKFQQSYSSGWGGSLRVPIAPYKEADSAISLARHQRSLPDIIDDYRYFLAIASREYEIIIGIDDLDKASDEQAQRFLREVKALSGLQSCFYLVSVPDESSFDTFFDVLVHVDYLSLDDAHRLVRRRVPSIPIPFVDFCYCMGGGFPRYVIRVLRSMFEHRSFDSGESSLSTLCGSLIRSDLRSKLHELSMAARASMIELGAYHTWETIHKLEALLASDDYFFGRSPDLLEIYSDLLDGASQASEPQAEPTKVAANRERVSSLSTWLRVYLYYSVTLLEFFGREDLSKETLKAAESSGALEQLAKARQFFDISPRAAELMITEFRKWHDLDTPSGVYENPA